MKKKIHKILGVGLTIMLLASLMVFAAPVAASPGTDEWETFTLPEADEDGDYFMDDTIGAVGPIARAIDGTIYAGVSSVTTAAVAATGTSTIPAGVTALDLALNIDGAAITLAYGDSATAIATKIAIAVTASGTVATATSAGAVVTFTARVAGTAGNVAVPMADAAYSGGTVPAATLAGGTNAVAQVDTVTPTVVINTQYILRITPTGGTAVDFVYTSSATADATEIVTAFNSLINSHPTLPVTASGTATLILTADVGGIAGGFTSASVGAGTLTIVPTTPAANATFGTITSTVPADVTGGLDLALDIDGAAVTLAYGDSATAIATKIATAVTASGTVATATSAAAVVTFTARVAGTAGNVAVPMADAAYYSGNTVPAVTLSGGTNAFSVGDNEIMKSLDNEGRSWEITDYSDDADDDVVAIVCSTVDADEVYVASSTTLWRTRDGGDSWKEVGDADLLVPATINCLAVGWDDDDDARVFVGANNGKVYYLYDVSWGTNWTNLNLDVASAAATDVLSIAVSPNFVEDSFQAVLAVDANETFVAWHVGSTPGGWDDIEIEDDAPANFVATGGALAFPADFDADDFEDGNQEIFVGIIGALHAGGDGGVVRIYDTTAGDYDILDDVDADIASLAIVGNLGDTQMLAGENGAADVWYSWDDGDNWEQASDEGIQPAGAGPTYVLMDEDFDGDTGIGWAATAPAEGGMHMTIDGGTSWQGVGLLDTDITALTAMAVVSSDEMYLLTGDGGAMEVFRFDGDNWERIYEQAQYGVAVDMIGVYEDTIVLAKYGATAMMASDDGGQIFAAPTKVPGDKIECLLVIDEDTWWVGDDDGDLWVTLRAGARTWDDYEITNDAITSLAVRGEEAIAGTAKGEVWYSEDEGETWDIVGDDLGTNADTYVAFADDSDTVIYAASDDVVARFLDIGDLDEDWEEFDLTDVDTFTTASGIACMNGVLYASSADAYTTTGTTKGAFVRIVNPLEDLDDIDESDVQDVIEGRTTANDEEFASLQITSASAPVLWANDIDEATLWTYEDTLAVQVELIGPPDGGTTARTDRATVSWEELDGADSYIVQWDASPDFDYAADDEDGHLTTTYSISGGILEAGQTFYWRVRVEDPVFSKWSDVWEFTLGIAGGEWNPFLTRDMYPGNVAPEPGAGDVPLRPTFQWNAADWATSYEFQLADNPEFTGATIKTLTTTAYAHDADLNYSTTYYWRVRAMSATSQSQWGSAIFTTVATPVVEFCCPDCGLCFDTEAELQAHWDTVHAVAPTTPAYIWVIIAVGALLVIAMLILIVRTRRTV